MVDLPCVPATATSRPPWPSRRRPRRPAARARAAMPDRRAAASSGDRAGRTSAPWSPRGDRRWRGRIDRRALRRARGVTGDAEPRRARPCRATERPGRSRSRWRPRAAASSAAAEAPAPAAPTTWMRFTGTMDRPRVACRAPRPRADLGQLRQRVMSQSLRAADRARGAGCAAPPAGAGAACCCGGRSPPHDDADSCPVARPPRPRRSARPAWPRCRRPGPRSPSPTTAEVAAEADSDAFGHGHRDLGGDRAVTSEQSAGTPSRSLLTSSA